MKLFRSRHWLVVAFATSLALAIVSGALANELLVGGVPRGLVIHGAEETLRHYCHADSEGRLWLEIPGGARFELVTSVDDPVITNRGDGAFHVFEVREVDLSEFAKADGGATCLSLLV